jgi:PAP2 superfamily protein
MLAYSFAGFFLIIVVAFARGTKDKYADFCFGAMLPITVFVLQPLGPLTSWLRPKTLDATLRSIDLAMGLDGFALTRFLVRMHVYSIIPTVYYLLPVVIAMAWVFERPKYLMRVLLLGAALALPFFIAIPACGPSHAYLNWPSRTAQLLPAIGPAYPRNCVPSMHFSWALALALNARNRIWQSLLWIFVALTGIATVGGGEHYFIDIIVAVPFTLALQWVASSVTGPGAICGSGGRVRLSGF